jgi:nitrogen regulatory protein PII
MEQLHRKKRIEIVVEAARVPAVIEMIEDAGAKGYTVVANVSGKGNRGVRGEAHLSDVFRNMLIIVIAAEEIASRIVERSQALLENYAGIVVVSDVEVVRDEHF